MNWYGRKNGISDSVGCATGNLPLCRLAALLTPAMKELGLAFIYKVIGGQTDRLIGEIMDTFIGEGRFAQKAGGRVRS